MKAIRLSYLGFLVFLFALKVSGQETEPVLARTYYQFIYVNDTTQRDHPREEEMVLYIGAHASFYKSNMTDVVNRQVEEQLSRPGFDGNITIVAKGKGTNESYYFLPASKSLKKTYQLAQEQYILDEAYPELNWELSTDTLTIGGYRCQKALTSFKGRTYTAWFAPELPFSFGPWKLQGLPGLILQAEDSKGEVSFRYKGFEKIEDAEMRMGEMSDYIKTDQTALDRLIAAFRKNPKAFLDAHSKGNTSPKVNIIVSTPKGDASSLELTDPNKIKSIVVKKREGERPAVDNNPIELTK